MKIGFSTEKYVTAQTEAIKERVGKFEKLYLEFGGKIITDYHAARVLPGYDPGSKIKVLQALEDNVEIIYCVSAKDLQSGKIRQDFELTHDDLALKEIKELKEKGLTISGLVITRYEGEKAATNLKKRAKNLRIPVYTSGEEKEYAKDIGKTIEFYAKQDRINTTSPVIIVTGTSPGAGKLATSLTQCYLDNKNGIGTGYAKLETFPVWNLDLDHPINWAYESATADLLDYNVVDKFHLKAYKKTAINYNRDIDAFPTLLEMIKSAVNKNNFVHTYKSPTDMGVNMIKEGIIDDLICRNAANQETIRRWFDYREKFHKGLEEEKTLEKMNLILKKLNLKSTDRKVVEEARKVIRRTNDYPINYSAAMQLHNEKIITGRNSYLLRAESSLLINAMKYQAGFNDDLRVLPENWIHHVQELNTKNFNRQIDGLNISEMLNILASSKGENPTAKPCLDQLLSFKGCQMHLTRMPSSKDKTDLRELGINLTSDVQLSID